MALKNSLVACLEFWGIWSDQSRCFCRLQNSSRTEDMWDRSSSSHTHATVSTILHRWGGGVHTFLFPSLCYRYRIGFINLFKRFFKCIFLTNSNQAVLFLRLTSGALNPLRLCCWKLSRRLFLIWKGGFLHKYSSVIHSGLPVSAISELTTAFLVPNNTSNSWFWHPFFGYVWPALLALTLIWPSSGFRSGHGIEATMIRMTNDFLLAADTASWSSLI